MPLNAEAIEQIIVVEFVKQIAKVPVYHFAGERKCSPQYGAILKRLGTQAGVSDLFFPRGNAIYKGMWLELKTKTGKPSPLQLRFLDDMRSEGYLGVIAYGSQEAINWIVDFYNLPDRYKKQ